MKGLIIFFSVTFNCISAITAQTFIKKATIEFEVKTNIKKTMGESMWAEMIKDNLPNFKTAYYEYTFSDNKSIYKFTHLDEKTKLPDFMKKEDESNEWYMDFDNGKIEIQKNLFGSNFNIKDSLPAIEWKISNESRVIAGFNCRKAIGKIYDSVYVFAFYSDEILISGGPCSINGLPGMILGLTIPRLYTSWIATTISVIDVKEASIKPINAKKTYLKTEFKKDLTDRIKGWGSDDENKKWQEQFLWNAML